MPDALIIGYGVVFDDANRVLLLRRRATEALWPERWWLPGDITPLDEEPDSTVPRIFGHLLRQQVRAGYLETVYGTEPRSGRHTVHNGYLVTVLEALDPQPEDETNAFDAMQWFDPEVALAELPQEQAALLAAALQRRADGWTPDEDITLEALFEDLPESTTDETPATSHAERRRTGSELLAEVTGQPGIVATLQHNLGPLGDYLIDHVWGDVWQDGRLAPRDRSLAACAAAAALHQTDAFAFNARIGERNGLTKPELIELTLQIAMECGFPPANEAITHLLADWRRDDPDYAPEPAPAKDDDQRRADAGRVAAQLGTSPGQIRQALGPNARLILEFAWGDIFSRPQLSLRDRALIGAAINVAVGQPADLPRHFASAMSFGVTANELHGTIAIASVFCGVPRAADAAAALQSMSAANLE